jgi:UDP-N-acetyl-D-mannosaminuronic acid transferase (WecB/TagA/CpsF family)
MPKDKLKILGINFFNGDTNDVVENLKSGGLLVVPAAPALITIEKDHSYYRSLIEADIVIADSGYMALIWNLFHKQKINRISGLEFLKKFVDDEDVKATDKFLLVNPQPKEALANYNYLRSKGFNISEDSSYLAPFYKKNEVTDPALLAFVEERKPKYIIINLGGGTQEKLGAYLKKNLSYKPAIICTGAAIAFLTGEQASIPSWADKFYLGWFFRCIEKPKIYIPRYFKAFRLCLLMMQYGKQSPVILKN